MIGWVVTILDLTSKTLLWWFFTDGFHWAAGDWGVCWAPNQGAGGGGPTKPRQHQPNPLCQQLIHWISSQPRIQWDSLLFQMEVFCGMCLIYQRHKWFSISYLCFGAKAVSDSRAWSAPNLADGKHSTFSQVSELTSSQQIWAMQRCKRRNWRWSEKQKFAVVDVSVIGAQVNLWGGPDVQQWGPHQPLLQVGRAWAEQILHLGDQVEYHLSYRDSRSQVI